MVALVLFWGRTILVLASVIHGTQSEEVESPEAQGQGEGCKPMGSPKQEVPRVSVRVAAPDGPGRTNPEASGTISLGWVINNPPPH